jgi:hypothetical protein
VADVPSGLSLTPPQETKLTNLAEVSEEHVTSIFRVEEQA